MSSLGTRIAVAGALLVLSALTGIILSSLGRPLKPAVFAVHKLLAVGSLVLAVLVLIGLRSNPGTGALPVTLTVLMGLFLLSLLATGAALSFDRPVGALLLTIHKLAPLGAAGSAVLLLCLRVGARN